ncbi:thiamine phosphate synthase [Bacteroides fragilis]|uniref:thiamine phosphate synthase n=1 Tax=Bacteroides fragilis TaxID=817 RepID=UPI00071029EB
MSGLLYYKSMLLANTAVSLDMNEDIKIARSGNTTDRQDEITAYQMNEADIQIPVVAIGGIVAEDIPAIMETGVNGIALSGAILQAPDPVEETKRILNI